MLTVVDVFGLEPFDPSVLNLIRLWARVLVHTGSIDLGLCASVALGSLSLPLTLFYYPQGFGSPAVHHLIPQIVAAAAPVLSRRHFFPPFIAPPSPLALLLLLLLLLLPTLSLIHTRRPDNFQCSRVANDGIKPPSDEAAMQRSKVGYGITCGCEREGEGPAGTVKPPRGS